MAYYETYMPDETGELQRVVINAGVGFCLPFYGTEAPPGTLACDGSEISREAYKELFAVLGTKAGAGNGVSTFNLPDFRGVFVRCIGGNADELGVLQEATLVGQYCLGLDGSYINHVVYRRDSDELLPESDRLCVYSPSGYRPRGEIAYGNQGWTARPVNVALLWCIIYE